MVLAPSVCQQSKISDLYIAVRKYMQKEPSDELISLQRHNFNAVTIGIVTPFERDHTVLKVDNTVIADGYSVGIPAQVFKDSVNAIKRRLAIDHPFLVIELYKQ